MNPGHAITRTSEVDIPPFRLVKFGSDNPATEVALATSATDNLIGSTEQVAGVAGSPVDVVIEKIPFVEFGGDVEAGDKLTADSQGRAIKATPSSGNTATIIGVSMTSGVAGTIGSYRHSLSTLKG